MQTNYSNKTSYLVLAVVFFGSLVITFSSCSSDDLYINNKDVPSVEFNDKYEVKNAIRAVIEDLFVQPNVSQRDIEDAVYQKLGLDKSTRSTAVVYEAVISDAALSVVNKIDAIKTTDFATKEEYLIALSDVLESNRNILTTAEFNTLSASLSITADIFDVMRSGLTTRSWWDSWGRCAAGVAGGALTGGLAGAAIGSAAPIIGTTAGAIIGAIGGGLTGAAAFC